MVRAGAKILKTTFIHVVFVSEWSHCKTCTLWTRPTFSRSNFQIVANHVPADFPPLVRHLPSSCYCLRFCDDLNESVIGFVNETIIIHVKVHSVLVRTILHQLGLNCFVNEFPSFVSCSRQITCNNSVAFLTLNFVFKVNYWSLHCSFHVRRPKRFRSTVK